MPEKCALSHGSGVLGRDPRDSCRFWSPHVGKVCTVTQFRLGEGGGGGGIPWGGGGSANREPGSYIRITMPNAVVYGGVPHYTIARPSLQQHAEQYISPHTSSYRLHMSHCLRIP